MTFFKILAETRKIFHHSKERSYCNSPASMKKGYLGKVNPIDKKVLRSNLGILSSVRYKSVVQVM